jgi:hypothetical protein
VSLDDRLHQINHSLRFFCERGVMIFPVQEVCCGKELVDKYLSSSLYLAFLVTIHGALGFPHGHLQSSWSLGRGGSSLVRCSWLSGECGVSTGGLGV